MRQVKALIFDWGDTLMRDFREYAGAMLYWPQVEAMPGTAEALAVLREEYLCCVASNAGDSDSELMGQALERVDLRRYFHRLFTSKELGAAKPDPGFFRAIMEEIAAAAPECIMVGNDYVKDIAAAKAVGMRTIWLAENGRPHEAPDADAVIGSMEQLIAAVRSLDAVR